MMYTHSEKTEKNYTVAQAVTAAETYLKEKKHRSGICTNALKRKSLNDEITLEELNKISNEIIDDSIFYGSY